MRATKLTPFLFLPGLSPLPAKPYGKLRARGKSTPLLQNSSLMILRAAHGLEQVGFGNKLVCAMGKALSGGNNTLKAHEPVVCTAQLSHHQERSSEECLQENGL